MNSGTVWACSHWNSLPWWAKTAAVLGWGVPACFFFLPRKRLQGLQPLWKTRGTQQSTSKWLVLLHTDLLPSRGCQGASLMQKRRWGTEGNNKKNPKHLYIQFKPQPSLSYKEEESRHSGINWKHLWRQEPEVRFYEWDHGYQMKAVCFCKDYPVSGFFIMTVLLLVHPLRAELISSLWNTADT